MYGAWQGGRAFLLYPSRGAMRKPIGSFLVADINIQYRDLLWLLTLREIRIRYARALLGAAWVLFLPVFMMAVFTVLDFSRLVPEGSPYYHVPYTLFAYSGLLPWMHFSSSLTQATPSLVNSRDMIKKSAFPREVIPLAKVIAASLDLAVGGLFLLVLLVWKRTPVHASVAAIPLVFLLQLAFTSGLALLCSAGSLFFRDVNYLVQVGVVLAMFATAVVYPIHVTTPWVQTLLGWNPMSSYLEAYRAALLLGEWPGEGILPGVVGAVASLAVGATVFRRLSPRFAEV
jgi:ABC-type polysaccharide/polyol phosphate export permease